MRRLVAAFLLLAWLPWGLAATTLRVGATTTLEDSGILEPLAKAFSASRRVPVRTLVAGTGQVMKYAENGDVDVIFTHSRPDEERLVARGIGKARVDVMWNDFVLAGPPADPARIRGMKDAAAAFRRIRESGAKFVSRADDSGTHKKELQLWAAAGGLVPWAGYLSAGQGAARTLIMADELEAYDLVDRATLRQLGKRHPLAVLVEGDTRLRNEYAVTTLKPSSGRAVEEALGEAFAAWLVSEEARRIISSYRGQGERVFFLPGESREGQRAP